MIPRFSICFALSVLLHGMLLLSTASAFRTGGKAYALHDNDGSGKMVVFLEAASDRTKSTAILPTEKTPTKPFVTAETQSLPAAAPAPTGSPAAIPSFGWLMPPQPEVRQQLNYRQLYEMQASQQAMQQAQMFISRLQADIEQSINLRGEPVTGRCDWQGNSPVLQCDSKSLLRQMLTEADRLLALRNAMKNQGNILDGFTVRHSGDRSTISYQVHSATADPAL